MKTATKASAKSPIRRRVRRDWRNGDLVAFKTKSFSKDDGTEYHPVIDLATGEFSCTCPDHVYRHRACKHIQRMAAQLKAELTPSGPHCRLCKGEENLYAMANEDGTPREGFQCRQCAAELRAQHEKSVALARQEEIGDLEARCEMLEYELAQMPDLESIAHKLHETRDRLRNLRWTYNTCEVLR